jgi:predicted transcriptional regulator
LVYRLPRLGSMAVTTIKVDTVLRDRLNSIARQDGVSVSKAIEAMVAERERAERFRAMREAIEATDPETLADYRREVQAWDVTLTDGLKGDDYDASTR